MVRSNINHPARGGELGYARHSVLKCLKVRCSYSYLGCFESLKRRYHDAPSLMSLSTTLMSYYDSPHVVLFIFFSLVF